MLCPTIAVALLALVSAAPLQDGLPRGVLFENQTWVEEQLKLNAKLLGEYRGRNGSANGYCNTGVMNMPACFQICDEWCWATIASMAVDYYRGEGKCQGLECRMPTREFGQECCPYTNSCNNQPHDPSTACNRGGYPSQMADGAGAFGGVSFSVHGPLDQASLDSALTGNRPVMITVNWQGGGGHALMIGGCGNGNYYLHDPWGWYSNQPPNWQSLSYDQLLTYVAPNGGVGRWSSSIVSSEDEAGHKAAMERHWAALAHGPPRQ